MFDVGPTEVAVILVIVGMWVALGVAILVVASRLVGRNGDPERMLRRRLARGEITPAEYQEAQRLLGR